MPTSKVVSITTGIHRARVLARRNALVVEHLSLAAGIARTVARHLPAWFALEDLVATANLALTRAATRYRPAAHNGTPFSAYARIVIRGALLSSVYRGGRFVENTRPGIAVAGRESDGGHSEAAPALNRAATVPNVVVAIDRGKKRGRIEEALTWLLPQEQRLLRLYYSAAEPTLAEVAGWMGIRPREAQTLHTAALGSLRRQLSRRAA